MSATAYENSRQIDHNFYVDGPEKTSISRFKEECYNQYISQTQAFWNEARTDQRYVAGDISVLNEIYSNIPIGRRKVFNFNRIRRVINMISGHQRKHRKATVIHPLEGADEETADQLTDVVSWAYGRESIYNTISDAFERGALTTGFSLLSLWLDRTYDPASGDIKCSHLAYNSYICDTFFRNMDLSDCSFIWTRKWVTAQEGALLLPEREEEILEMRPPRYGTKDQKFYFMPENYNFATRNLLPYDEFYYQDTREQTILYDTRTGEVMEWDGDKDRLKMFLETYPEIQSQKTTVPTTKLAISINDRVLYDGPNLLGIDRYPFVPVVGYWDPDATYFMWRMQGVVRGLRDAQFLYSRRKVIELDIMESQVNSGVDVMEGALVDNNDVLRRGQGQPTFVKQNPLGLDAIRRVQPPAISPTTIQLSEILAREIQEISGVNEELLGSADDDKAGILSMLRQGAGLVTLERLFDQLDQSQRLLGEITLQVIQKNFTLGKVRRILGEEPTDQFKNKAFQKYDCFVGEGLLTDSQRKLEFIQYMNLQQMGMQIPSEIMIEKAPIHGKKELKDAIARREQAQAQAEQQAQQIQMQGLEAENQTKVSFSHAQHALAAERMAKVSEERAVNAEKLERAKEERTAGVLNLIKALKELQGMDIDQLAQKVNILNMLSSEVESEKVGGESPQAPKEGRKGTEAGNQGRSEVSKVAEGQQSQA